MKDSQLKLTSITENLWSMPCIDAPSTSVTVAVYPTLVDSLTANRRWLENKSPKTCSVRNVFSKKWVPELQLVKSTAPIRLIGNVCTAAQLHFFVALVLITCVNHAIVVIIGG